MLSADTPEFVPRALRAQSETALEQGENGCLAGSSTATESSDTVTSSKEANSGSSESIDETKFEHKDETPNSANGSRQGTQSSSSDGETLNIKSSTIDGGSSSCLEAVEISRPTVISTLSATSAEFYPSADYGAPNVYFDYNSPAHSPVPHISFHENHVSQHHQSYMFSTKSPMYYETSNYPVYCYPPWSQDVSYSHHDFYGSIESHGSGQYTTGEYYVPDGGMVYEGNNGSYAVHPPVQIGNSSGSGMLMDPSSYFDSSLMHSSADYGGTYGRVHGAQGLFRGARGYGSIRGRYTGGSRNRNKKPPDQNGIRGGGNGAVGGRGPSTEFRICGQTGEFSVGARSRALNQNQQLKQSVPVTPKASACIFSNASNWPSLGVMKGESEATVATSESNGVNTEMLQKTTIQAEAKLDEEICALTFSSIAKKGNDSKPVIENGAKVVKTAQVKNQDMGSNSINNIEEACHMQDANIVLKVDSSKDIKFSALCNSKFPTPKLNTRSCVVSKDKTTEVPNAPNVDSALSKSAKKRAKLRMKRSQRNDSEQGALNETVGVESADVQSLECCTSETKSLSQKASSLSVKTENKVDECNSGKKSKKKQKSINESNGTLVNSSLPQQESKSTPTSPKKSNSQPRNLEAVEQESKWITVSSKRSKNKRNFNTESNSTSTEAASRTAALDSNSDVLSANGDIVLNRANESDSNLKTEVYNDVSKPGINVETKLVKKILDPHSPEALELKKQRQIKKENLKKQKQLKREAAALEKQALSRKDTKVSLIAAVPAAKASEGQLSESFNINAAEYPSLGCHKEKESKFTKYDLKKINGIIQQDDETIFMRNLSSVMKIANLKQKTLKANVQNSSRLLKEERQNAASSSVEVSAQNKELKSQSLAPQGSWSRPLSYSGAASASVSGAVVNLLPAPATVTYVSASSGEQATPKRKNKQTPVIQPKSKHVKSTDKIQLNLGSLLERPMVRKSQSSSYEGSRGRTGANTSRYAVNRPSPRVTAPAQSTLRIKGRKYKRPSRVALYKREHNRETKNLLMLLAELKRRQIQNAGGDLSIEGLTQTSTSLPEEASVEAAEPITNYCVNTRAVRTLATQVDSKRSQLNTGNDSKKLGKQKKSTNGMRSVTEASCVEPVKDSALITGSEMQVTASSAPILSNKQMKEIAEQLERRLFEARPPKVFISNYITKDLEQHLTVLISSIVRFQRRLYATDPIKASAKRRYVSGIQETRRKLHKIRLLVVARNVGNRFAIIREQVTELVEAAKSRDVPVVFGLDRASLARLCLAREKHCMSCLGIINYQGAEESVNKIFEMLPELQERAKKNYASSLPKDKLATNVTSTADITSSNSSSMSTPSRRAFVAAEPIAAQSLRTSGAGGLQQVNEKVLGILKSKDENNCSNRKAS